MAKGRGRQKEFVPNGYTHTQTRSIKNCIINIYLSHKKLPQLIIAAANINS